MPVYMSMYIQQYNNEHFYLLYKQLIIVFLYFVPHNKFKAALFLEV